MATILQCLLTRPADTGRYLSVRWVVKKKAVVGNHIVASNFEESAEHEWTVDTVYQLEQEDRGITHDGKPCQCYFNVVK